MFVVIGYVMMCICIFGADAAHGGELMVLWQPAELSIIFGGCTGAMIVAFGGQPLKSVLKNLPRVFKGNPYGRAFHMDLFALLYEILSKVRKEGLMSIEGDVETPERAPCFPNIRRLRVIITSSSSCATTCA